METIKEIQSTIGRETDDQSTLSLENNISENIVDSVTITHNTNNQSSSQCGIGQEECSLSKSLSKTSIRSSDSIENKSIISKKVSKKFFTFNMNLLLQYSKELVGLIALILTTYATLLNKESVIGGTTIPKPIFSLDSIVQEWPNGNLVEVQSKVAVSELSLIYFYAPWCAESLHARKVYSSIADIYKKEAYFAAVNCWQPNSGCRNLYSNVYKWPVLMAYLPNALSVQYNGDWNLQSLSKFIDGLLIPIVRINSPKELLNLRISNDGVVFGLFKSCDTKEFQIYFQTAIKWLESSYYETTKFVVYVGEKTSMFSDSEALEAPVIKLFTINDTFIYNNSKWSSKTIIIFLKQKLANSTIWINLPSSKSLTMQKHLQNGPVLMMTAPKVPLSNHFLIMKQLIYTFNNYPTDLNNSVFNEYLSDLEKEHQTMLNKLKNFCEFSRKLHEIRSPHFVDEFWSVGFVSGTKQRTNISKQNSFSTFSQSIAENKNNINHCHRRDAFAQQDIDNLDSRSPSAILKNYMEKQCANLKNIPKQYIEKTVVEPINPTQHINYEYRGNRTLKFLLLDSVVHHDYIRHFAGDNGKQEHSTFSSPQLFIIDNERETLHMQKGPISTKNSFKFVNEYYHGKLNRHYRSFNRPDVKIDKTDKSLIRIKEINSRQFLKVINRTNMTSVVLFYTPHCALCNIMSQALLHVSNIIKLRSVKFYRINASANEVCWEYTMDTFPTLIVFPQNRSSDTNVFLTSLPKSVKSVFSYILSNLNSEQQLNSLINACMLSKLSSVIQSCLSQVREMVNNEISHQLQKWNNPSTNRTHVLTRLKELKGIYIELLRARKTEDVILISKEIYKYGNERY